MSKANEVNFTYWSQDDILALAKRCVNELTDQDNAELSKYIDEKLSA